MRGAFNRRHKRVGHLFQNRYKSIVVDEAVYLLELVRSRHLNPLRAGVVPDLRALDRYPWTGHSALLGQVRRPWQETAPILAQFGPRGRRAYRAFVAAGIPQGRRPEFQGGGLVRSAGGWQAVGALRRGREAYAGDERVLGGSDFVEHLRRSAADTPTPAARGLPLETLVARVCQRAGIRPEQFREGSRRAAVSHARNGIAYLWVAVLGHPGRPLASLLGVRPQAVYQAVARGQAAPAAWDRLLET